VGLRVEVVLVLRLVLADAARALVVLAGFVALFRGKREERRERRGECREPLCPSAPPGA